MLGVQKALTLVAACRSNAVERQLIDAVGEYVHAYVERHGHGCTEEAFGVSRHTLWRFLERGEPGRTLPWAVTGRAGDSPGRLAAATRALAGETLPAPPQRPLPPLLTRGLRGALLVLCEAPFATVDELSRMRQAPVSTPRGRLAPLRERDLAALGETTGDDMPRLYPVSRQWFRLLSERLDAVALVYALTAYRASN